MFSGRIGTEPAPRPGRQQMEKAAKGEISCQDQCEIGFSFLGGRPRRGQGCDRAWKKSGLTAVCVLENSRGARSSWVASRTFLPSHAATGFVCLREASLKRMDGQATGIKTSRRRREERTKKKKKNHSAVSRCHRYTRNGYWETQLASQAKLPLAASGLCFLGSDVLIALCSHGPSRSDASLRALRVARTHGTEEAFFSCNKVDEWACTATE